MIGIPLAAAGFFSYYVDDFDATGTAETLTLSRSGNIYTLSSSSNGANFVGVAGFSGDQEVHADINHDNGIGPGRTLTALTLWTETQNGSMFPAGAGQFDFLVIESPGISPDINPPPQVPATSIWGLSLIILALMSAGALLLQRRRPAEHTAG